MPPKLWPHDQHQSAHLYDKYWGTMLAAAEVDTNDQFFPLAFTKVEAENNEIVVSSCPALGREQRADL